MKILETGARESVLLLQKSELLMILNALNETLESLEDWEVPIRVGAETGEVEKFHRELHVVLAKMDP